MNIKNPQERRFYVYLWWNDDKEEVFYVGKGTKNRYKEKKNNRNKWFIHIVEKYKCHPEIIINNLTSDQALKMERMVEIILRKNNVKLVNLTECGGQPPLTQTGESNPNYGHKWTEEKRKTVSKKMKETKCHAGDKNGRCRKVKVIETNEVFNSIKDLAEKFFNADINSVRSSIQQRGKYKGYNIIKI